jgi:hypothetical protein
MRFCSPRVSVAARLDYRDNFLFAISVNKRISQRPFDIVYGCSGSEFGTHAPVKVCDVSRVLKCPRASHSSNDVVHESA